MVEENGLFLHLDPQGDRMGNSDLDFSGWVAADQMIVAVALAAEQDRPLVLCQRPDVERVLPGRIVVGFSGTARGSHLQADHLRVRVQLENEAFEFDHPVPPALAMPPWRGRIVSRFRLAWLGLLQRLTSDPACRWRFALRRHLLQKAARAGIFRRLHADALLKDFASAVPQAVFLQIGANDGLTGDPIHDLLAGAGRRWRGVLIEPVAHLFAQLSERYAGNPALRLERAAIAESDGETVIYRLETTGADSLFLDQLPSLDQEVVRRNARQFTSDERVIMAESVPSFCVATLLARARMARLDLLIIDTEGWDWRILRQFDLDALQPKLVLYEHQHLSLGERAEAQAMLARFGYEWAETPEGDTVAWRMD